MDTGDASPHTDKVVGSIPGARSLACSPRVFSSHSPAGVCVRAWPCDEPGCAQSPAIPSRVREEEARIENVWVKISAAEHALKRDRFIRVRTAERKRKWWNSVVANNDLHMFDDHLDTWGRY